MISTEYTLVKWLKGGDYRELPITIQEEAVRDFCEMMDWDEEEFANNTVRRPIVCEEEEEENLKNSVQTIKPIKITNPKAAKEIKKAMGKKRKRRTKAEMQSFKEKEQTKGKGVRPQRTKQQKYPDEMKEFIERHMNQNSNQKLCDLINEKYDVGIIPSRLAAYMAYKRLKRDKKPKEEKKKVKVERNSEIDKFIQNHKSNDVYVIRDEIIEKFGRNMSMTEIKKVLSKKVKNSKKESVGEEVKRITKKRDDDFEDDLDLNNN